MKTRSERVRFPGAFGDELAARVELPAAEPRAWALFAHCFTCSKDLKAVGHLSRSLAERGIAVLRFDFTGLGESAGDFADTNFTSNLENLLAAAEFMRREYQAPQVLIGHSLGGSAMLAVAGRIPEARAVATIGAPSDTDHVRGTLLSQAPELDSAEEAEVNLAGRPFRIRRQLLEDLADHRLQRAIGDLGRPLLILHSPTDLIVDIDHARRIYKAARHPKSFISLDGADHLLLERDSDARFVGEILAVWSGRYVEGAEREDAAPEEIPHGEVRVVGGPEGFANRVSAGRHTLAADEPLSVGGTDTGPGPYDLLLASLGACKSMTMRMYADRKGWPLERTEVRLRHSRIHAEDCADCETEKGRIDQIAVELGVEGDLDEEQRQRILDIAERCPVHRTLTTETKIVSTHLPPAEADGVYNGGR